MTYKALDDRPGVCEGCNIPDHPTQWGPSTKQICWNSVLRLWLCVDCRYQWGEWEAKTWDTEERRESQKPFWLRARENGKAGGS